MLRSATDSSPEEDELAEAQRQRDTPDVLDEPAFQALNASAHFDRVLYDGGEFGTATAAGSPEEEDFLGLPGLLEPNQVRTLLSKRQQSQLTARSRAPRPAPAPPSNRPHPNPPRVSRPAHAAPPASTSPARATPSASTAPVHPHTPTTQPHTPQPPHRP